MRERDTRHKEREEREREREMGVEERQGIELVVVGSESSPSMSLCQCRICHEEEEEESTTMESPCTCSGSLKFAHRGCIQRWCDEKGSTVCEICLQKFEPGYTLPPKVSHLIDVVVTIRGSLEVPRLNYEPHSAESDHELSDYADPECSSSAGRGASWYRSFALMVAIVLLFRHLIIVITVGPDNYAFTLATVFLLRASGILLPFYLVMRMVAAIQRAQWQQRRLLRLHVTSRERNGSVSDGEEDVGMHQNRIQI